MGGGLGVQRRNQFQIQCGGQKAGEQCLDRLRRGPVIRNTVLIDRQLLAVLTRVLLRPAREFNPEDANMR